MGRDRRHIQRQAETRDTYREGQRQGTHTETGRNRGHNRDRQRQGTYTETGRDRGDIQRLTETGDTETGRDTGHIQS